MEEYIVKGQEKLRWGYTTGSCATAATKAATWMLLAGEDIEEVRISTPKGISLSLEVYDTCRKADSVSCAIIKDAGDDPDVTHGMKIYAKVTKNKEKGIHIDGGIGIGRVTQKGLKCDVGEAAINPVPRKMIEEAVKAVCKNLDYKGGIDVLIYAPEGEEISKKTYNSRLGIIGGISILGTSGIVEPMSESALVETIHMELKVRQARKLESVLISPGNYGRDFALQELEIDLEESIKYSNYLGETLDYITYLGFKKVLLVGHIGKLVKVAAGIMNTHSKYADGRMEVIAVHTALQGYSSKIIKDIMESKTTDAALQVIEDLPHYEQIIISIINKIKEHIDFRVKNKVQVELILFGENGIIGTSRGAKELIQYFKEGENDEKIR